MDKQGSLLRLRIHHECEGEIEISVTRIIDWHHETWQVMVIGDHEGRICLSHPHTNNDFFSGSPLITSFFIRENMKKSSRKS